MARQRKERLDALLVERGQAQPFVSRGGHKLAAALDAFALNVTGWVAADVGLSGEPVGACGHGDH